MQFDEKCDLLLSTVPCLLIALTDVTQQKKKLLSPHNEKGVNCLVSVGQCILKPGFESRLWYTLGGIEGRGWRVEKH